jgi:hypothetical protein
MTFQPKACALGMGIGTAVMLTVRTLMPLNRIETSIRQDTPVAILAAATGPDEIMHPASPSSVLLTIPTDRPTHSPRPQPTGTPASEPTRHPTRLPTPAPTPAPVADPGQMDRWFDQYSGQYAVDRELLKRIAVCESRLNQGAVNGPYGGLYQFTESSWRSTRNAMSADTSPDLRFHAEEAIRTAAFKISVSGTGAWPSCSK